MDIPSATSLESVVSAFDDRFSACAAPMLADQYVDANAVTYTPKTGDSITFDAILGPEDTERRQDPRTQLETVYRIRSVFVLSVDKSRSEIEINGTVTIDTVEYAISHIGSEVGGMYAIELERIALGEIGRDGYRERRGRR